jgi:DNA-directed RNA polymerase subunit RPC12/RpoP
VYFFYPREREKENEMKALHRMVCPHLNVTFVRQMGPFMAHLTGHLHTDVYRCSDCGKYFDLPSGTKFVPPVRGRFALWVNRQICRHTHVEWVEDLGGDAQMHWNARSLWRCQCCGHIIGHSKRKVEMNEAELKTFLG